MSRSPSKFLIIVILIVAFFVLINQKFLSGRLNLSFSLRYAGDITGSIFSKLSGFKKAATLFAAISHLKNKTIELEKRNYELLSQLSDLENIKSENAFFRKALNISKVINREYILANIYSWNLGPNGYAVLLNAGKFDGIKNGDVIISEEKILIGTVLETDDYSSKILAATDPKFRITAKILGSDTAGIASGALLAGMSFDLIFHEDTINEGDIVVSSGNDTFPPALIIGRVKQINLGDGQLFKEIIIDPAMKEIIIGRVIVLKNR